MCFVSGVSPPGIKGFSGQPVTVAGFSFADYGNPMGTQNFQIHFNAKSANPPFQRKLIGTRDL